MVNAGISGLLAVLGYSQQNLAFISDVILGFSFPISVLIYFRAYRKMNGKEIIEALGVGRSKLSLFTLVLGFLIFIIIMILSIGTGIIQNIINIPINTNVNLALEGAPLWFCLFVAVIEPINEELLFRGFMVPRIGIVLSSVVFGVLHASYDSTFAIEVIAAVLFGILSGYVYKRTGSLYPSIIAHILVNTLAVLAFIG